MKENNARLAVDQLMEYKLPKDYVPSDELAAKVGIVMNLMNLLHINDQDQDAFLLGSASHKKTENSFSKFEESDSPDIRNLGKYLKEIHAFCVNSNENAAYVIYNVKGKTLRNEMIRRLDKASNQCGIM